jgi:cytochrome c oxidase subunit III
MLNSLTKRREPFEFMLYLAMAGSTMLFLLVIFVFIYKENFNQINIKVPILRIFWFSTWIILLSSATLHWANKAFRQERFRSYRLNIGLTLLAGIIFIILQFLGWYQFFSSGITLKNDTGGMFIFILSGLHVAHTIGGIIALVIANFDAFRNIKYVDSYVYSVNPPNQLKIRLISIYWHFVDILWITLFLFLLYHASQNSGNSH